MQDLAETIKTWLLDRAFQGTEVSEIIAGLGERLTTGGCQVARISLGRVLLHPLVGVAALEWDGDTGETNWDSIPTDRMSAEFISSTPFGSLRLSRDEMFHADLTDPGQRARFALFEKLHAQGMTGYAAFERALDSNRALLAEVPELAEGTAVSFCTRKPGGFTREDLAFLSSLVMPLFVGVRISTENALVSLLMETYLGHASGQRVLTGQSKRGDGDSIDCALFYSDIRNSLGLSERMEAGAFLDLVNEYFDCTAGAVLEHGGEVLKFVGDGVLAIFPFEDGNRPREDMCNAALAAAREAFARAARSNARRRDEGLPEFDFGLALHVGTVIYGNVGVPKRLDFTATGPAVGQVSRCEGMTRELGAPLIATAAFSGLCTDPGRPLGRHALRGIPGLVSLTAYDTEAD